MKRFLSTEPIKTQAGFTLIEVLIALAIFAISFLGIAAMQDTAINANRTANNLSTASSLAEGIMEEILAWDENDPRIQDDVTGQAWEFANGTDNLSLGAGGQYEATYDVDVAYGGVPKLARIEIEVTGGSTFDKQTRTLSLVAFKRLP